MQAARVSASAAGAPSGVAPEHYAKLGCTPASTASELQAAYAVECNKVQRGPLAVLEMAQLAEALRATQAVAPVTAEGSGTSGIVGTAGGAAEPKPVAMDDAQRANLAMQKAMAYKAARKQGRDPREATTNAVENGISDVQLPDDADEEETPRWVELTRITNERRPEIMASLKAGLLQVQWTMYWPCCCAFASLKQVCRRHRSLPCQLSASGQLGVPRKRSVKA